MNNSPKSRVTDIGRKRKLENFGFYLFKCTTENVEETDGCVLEHCEHLKYKTATRTQQAQCSDSLGVMQSSHMRLLLTGVIGTVNTTVGSDLMHVTHKQKQASGNSMPSRTQETADITLNL